MYVALLAVRQLEALILEFVPLLTSESLAKRLKKLSRAKSRAIGTIELHHSLSPTRLVTRIELRYHPT
jgi:hypothetical protein